MTGKPETAARPEIVQAVASGFAEWGAGSAEELGATFEKALGRFSDAELARFWERVETTGSTWGYNPPDPVARLVSRLVHARLDVDGSELYDDGGLQVAHARPVIFLGNHLSFIDANSVDCLLSREGYADIADRITVLAGPKVFALPIRRLASLSFGTVKMPQSPSRASGEAVMSRRDTLELAKDTLATALERRRSGEHLLIFSEGSRSRSGAMARVLPAVTRYVEDPFGVIVPSAVWGTEKVIPLDEDYAHLHPVCVRFGRAIDARELFERAGRKRVAIADAVGYLTADLLPPAYRGCDASGSQDSRVGRVKHIDGSASESGLRAGRGRKRLSGGCRASARPPGRRRTRVAARRWCRAEKQSGRPGMAGPPAVRVRAWRPGRSRPATAPASPPARRPARAGRGSWRRAPGAPG